MKEFKLVASTDIQEFNRTVSELVEFEWQPVGSHQITTLRTTERAGVTYFVTEYSITLVREQKEKIKKVRTVVEVLKTLRKDAEMALSGEWDCTTREGIESFNDQIELIDFTLDKLKSE